MVRRPFQVHAMLASALVLSAVVTACDQPQFTEPLDRTSFRLAAAFTPGAGVVTCSETAGATVVVAVKDSKKKPAAGVVVTAVDPQVIGGDRCWGETDADGEIEFNNLQGTDGTRFFTVRSEISIDAPYLEIVPPAAVNGLSLAYDPAGVRNAAVLIGGTRCTDSPFSWQNLLNVVGTPCTLAEITKPIAVTMPAATSVLSPVFKDLAGNPLAGVTVAALSGAAFQSGAFDESKVDEWCGYLSGFVDLAECSAALSHGPAFVQAMTVTDATGAPPTGLAVGSGPVVIEAVAPFDGAALFGTIILAQGASPSQLVLEPGICKVSEADDTSEPNANPAVNLKHINYGVGLSLESDNPGGPQGAILRGIPTTLLVKLSVLRNGAGGTGDVTFNIRTAAANGNNSVKASFQVTPTACSVTGFAGLNALEPAVGRGYCRNDGGNAYTLVFELYDLPQLSEALFSIKSSGDNFDTSRSGLTSASLPFDLTADVCPIQLNTDGRLVGIS